MITKNKKAKNENKKRLYDFGFGLVDPETSDFETLARGMGLDPHEVARVLMANMAKEKIKG